MSYLRRSPDLHDLAGTRLESRLAANHARAVGKHGDADKWKAIPVPGEGREILIPSDGVLGDLVLLNGELRGDIVDRDVDVADVEVDGGDELDSSNLGDGAEDLGTIPGVEDERCKPCFPRLLSANLVNFPGSASLCLQLLTLARSPESCSWQSLKHTDSYPGQAG